MLVITIVDGDRELHEGVASMKDAAMARVASVAKDSMCDVEDLCDLTVECFEVANRQDFLFRVFREARFEFKLLTRDPK